MSNDYIFDGLNLLSKWSRLIKLDQKTLFDNLPFQSSSKLDKCENSIDLIEFLNDEFIR